MAKIFAIVSKGVKVPPPLPLTDRIDWESRRNELKALIIFLLNTEYGCKERKYCNHKKKSIYLSVYLWIPFHLENIYQTKFGRYFLPSGHAGDLSRPSDI